MSREARPKRQRSFVERYAPSSRIPTPKKPRLECQIDVIPFPPSIEQDDFALMNVVAAPFHCFTVNLFQRGFGIVCRFAYCFRPSELVVTFNRPGLEDGELLVVRCYRKRGGPWVKFWPPSKMGLNDWTNSIETVCT